MQQKIEKINKIQEIKNFFSNDLYNKLFDLSIDSNNYTLTGYDPNGFWDNRAKKIYPDELVKSLNNEFEIKTNEHGKFNKIVLVKFLDNKSITMDGKYAVEPHNINNPPQYWQKLCIINIDDSYGGGEIYFPDKNITIKQEKNSAVLFDGNTIYQINPITYGKKYMLTIFGK